MGAITVASNLPAVAVVLRQEDIEQIDILADRAIVIPITTVEEQRAADALHREIKAFSTAIEQQREALKRPCLEYGRAVDAAAASAQEILKPTLAALAGRIQGFIDQENAKRAEAARKAREEQERRQAEEDARAAAAAEEARRVRAEAALAAAAVTPETPPWELPPPVEPESPVEHLPVRVEQAWTPPPLVSSAVRKSTRKRVRIVNEREVPLMVNGIRLWKEIDTKAAETLFKSGVAVPGLAYEDEMQVGAKGSRSE